MNIVTKQNEKEIQRKYRKTMRRIRMRKWGMVFLFLLLAPVFASWVLPGETLEQESWRKKDAQDSRLTISLQGENTSQQFSMEEYLYGYLPSVISAEYELETLKAQAILLRTGLLRSFLEQTKTKGENAWNTSEMDWSNQTMPLLMGTDQENLESREEVITENILYLKKAEVNFLSGNQLKILWGENYLTNSEKIRQAVDDTKGIYITYNGEPILASFFSVSSGKTRNAYEVLGQEIPYLTSVVCPQDYLSLDYLTQKTIKKTELERMLGGKLLDLKYDSTGYCQSVIYQKTLKDGSVQRYTMSAEAFRQHFGLASCSFVLQEKENRLLFTIKGHGHGLGFCQFAANQMALQGSQYNAILSYFFQNIVLDRFE